MLKADVIKQWGENASVPKDNLKVQKAREGKRAIILSAMRSEEFNTTTNLEEIGVLLKDRPQGYLDKIDRIIKNLEDFHLQLMNSQGADDTILQEIKNMFEYLRNSIKSYLENYADDSDKQVWFDNDYTIWYRQWWNYQRLSLIWFWEVISAKLNTLFFQPHYWEKVWNMMNIGGGNFPTFYNAKSTVGMNVSKILQKKDIVFIPWYLQGTGNVMQQMDRGYSDPTAALVALWLKQWKNYEHDNDNDITLGIEKMVDGFMTWDPRIVDNPELIRELNYLLAEEIVSETWPQPKLLHAQALNWRVQEAGIPVKLYNPFSSSPGTLITRLAENMPDGVFFVWWVEDIDTLVMSSGRMKKWFIAKTSSMLTKAWVNIKEPFWSATEQSYAFSRQKTDLEGLIDKIRRDFRLTHKKAGEFIELRQDYSLVYCVGNMKDVVGTLNDLTSAFKENNLNIKAITQWPEQRAIAIMVPKEDYKKTVRVLHDKLAIKKKPN